MSTAGFEGSAANAPPLSVQDGAVTHGLLPLAPVLGGAALPSVLDALLFGDAALSCHVLLDAAAHFGLRERITQSDLPHASLWSGEAQADFGDHAPYLVTLTPQSRLTRSLFTRSERSQDLWGRVSPVFLRTPLSLDAVRARMRRVAMVTFGGKTGQDPRRGLLRFWQADLLAPMLRLGPAVPGLFAHWQVAFAGTRTLWFGEDGYKTALWPEAGAEIRLPGTPLDPAEFRLLTLSARHPEAETGLRDAFCVPWFRDQGGAFDRLFSVPGIAHAPLIAACAAVPFRDRVGRVIGAGLSDSQTAFVLSRLYGGL